MGRKSPIKPTMSTKKEEQTVDERRAEIMKKVAEAKAMAAVAQMQADQEARENVQQDPKNYGTHTGITCDGCGVVPMVGYRWRCTNCQNHDLCDACFDTFKNGELLHTNSRRNPISMKLEDHTFAVLVEKGVFKPIVKGASVSKKRIGKKLKANDPCHCGSGKKLKKCCKK